MPAGVLVLRFHPPFTRWPLSLGRGDPAVVIRHFAPVSTDCRRGNPKEKRRFPAGLDIRVLAKPVTATAYRVTRPAPLCHPPSSIYDCRGSHFSLDVASYVVFGPSPLPRKAGGRRPPYLPPSIGLRLCGRTEIRPSFTHVVIVENGGTLSASAQAYGVGGVWRGSAGAKLSTYPSRRVSRCAYGALSTGVSPCAARGCSLYQAKAIAIALMHLKPLPPRPFWDGERGARPYTSLLLLRSDSRAKRNIFWETNRMGRKLARGWWDCHIRRIGVWFRENSRSPGRETAAQLLGLSPSTVGR